MSDKVWERGLQSSAIIMNFLAIFCLETAVFAAFPVLEAAMEDTKMPQPSLVCQLCMIFVPFLFWLIRETVRYFWLFIVAHGAVAAAAVLLLGHTGMQRLVFGVFLAGYMVNSFRIRLTGHETEDGHENLNGKGMEEKRMGAVISGIIAVITYFLCAYVGDETGCSRIWNTALLFAFFFFIDVYLQNVDRFVQVNRSSNSHIPVKGMLVRGGTLTLGFGTAVTLILAAGIDNELTRTVTDFIRNTALAFIRIIGKIIAFILSLLESEGGESVEESVPQEMVGAMGMAEAVEQPWWVELFARIVEIAILAGAAVIISFFLYKLISEAIRRFYIKKDVVSDKNSQMIEIRENLKKEKEKREQEKTLSLFARTPEERIRKSFIKTVKKTDKFRNPDGRNGGAKGKDLWRRDAQENLIRGLTARQICDKVELTGQTGEPKTGWLGIELSSTTNAVDSGEVEKLLKLYEQARYGNGSSADDAKRAEQAAGKLIRGLQRR